MAHLKLSFLGTYLVTLDRKPVTGFEYDKVRALLAYLAVESNRPHRRAKLAGMLWPDRQDMVAHRNLSQALYKLRAAIDDRGAEPPYLCISPGDLQFNLHSDHSLDVSEFERLLASGVLEDFEAGLDLYRGDLLDGFSAHGSTELDEWILLKRRQLRRLAAAGFGSLVERYEERGDLERALQSAWRWVEIAPLREDAQRGVIRILAATGQRAMALAHYESYQQRLEEELGVEPEPETRALNLQLRARYTSIDGALAGSHDCPTPVAPPPDGRSKPRQSASASKNIQLPSRDSGGMGQF